jgi:hypothetical protein
LLRYAPRQRNGTASRQHFCAPAATQDAPLRHLRAARGWDV